MEEISESVIAGWEAAAKELKKVNAERRRKGQRGLSEKQWRALEEKRSLKREKKRLEEQEKQNGEVTYFIQGKTLSLIKIGLANLVGERLKDLQTGSPDILVILKTVPGNMERVYHKKFASLRTHGEWFRPDPELLEFINKL